MSKVREMINNVTGSKKATGFLDKNENVVNIQRFDFTDRTNGRLVYLTNLLNGYLNVKSDNAKALYNSLYKSFVREFVNEFNYTKSMNPVKNSNNSKFIKAWNTAKSTTIGNDKYNPVKEAAWIVCHSDKFTYKLTWDEYRTLIPTKSSTEVIMNWNHFIEVELKDVDDSIKKLFIIDKNRKAGVFNILKNSETIKDPNEYMEVPRTESAENNIKTDAVKEEENKTTSNTSITETNSEAKKEFNEVIEELDKEVDAEVDDAPVEKAGAEIIDDKEKFDKFFDEIRTITRMTAESSSIDDSMKDSIYSALSNLASKFTVASTVKSLPIIEGEFTEVDSETEEAKKKSEELDNQMKDAIARDDEKDTHKKGGEVIPEHPTEGTLFAENNIPWETRIPKLNILTNICKDKGYNVSYETCTYPGIILATIYSMNENKALVMVRQLLVDPMVIYGDTIRVIPMTSSDDKFNIRKEMFIPITNKKLIIKAIDGTITKEDRDAFFSKLPRCISDFRNKYHILDRVDLRCLNADGSPVNFFAWRSMVTNISKVLASKEIPEDCRFRITNFKDGNHFEMVCDEKVLLSIDSDIFEQENHRVAVVNNLKVEYDTDKYKEGDTHFKIING